MRKLTSLILSLVLTICMVCTSSFAVKAAEFKSYTFDKMTYNTSYGVEYSVLGEKLNVSFQGKYKEIRYYLPETLDMANCKSVTFNANSTNGKIAFKLYNTDGKEIIAHYDFKNNGDCTFTPDSTDKVDCVAIMSMETYNFSATVNSVKFKMGSLIEKDPIDPQRNLLTTYGQAFDTVGAALVASKIANPVIMNYTKEEHNSVTPGNEIKPDAILGGSAKTMTVAEAKELGYNIPEGYTEATVPVLNFTTVDNMLKTCYDNGMTMRGHTLVWHQQTPDWYFRENYSASGNYVSKEVMNERMEFYIRTVMEHVYNSPYGSVLYAWDVVNEYLHAHDSGWQKIYGGNLGTTPEFVKTAFEIAYNTLEKFGLEKKVKLFYNDYNTYEKVNEVINLINFINSDKKVCAGIGMQSHLATNYPSVSNYKKALNAFLDAGFEVQITELDVTCSSESVQAKYYHDLMSVIMEAKKAGGNITALIFWGLTDEDSWRSSQKPLLYSDYSTQKAAYEEVLKAFEESGYVKEDPALYGDVDGDGKINVKDLLAIKEYVAGVDVTINEKNSDVNGDNKVDLFDVILVQQYLKKVIVTFPVEK
ncbi:endo-1,4-beta-xylanase [uncultured Clostridium sp.]|uniref:endo-1,4-beta-xylanase n=1 Tax=uncultured Clostridium sp. TaxID=59620 RepID=UPI0025D3BE6F|nr:endo-1,4-beta-xylanase [uncultured Clostridium sp.]